MTNVTPNNGTDVASDGDTQQRKGTTGHGFASDGDTRQRKDETDKGNTHTSNAIHNVNGQTELGQTCLAGDVRGDARSMSPRTRCTHISTHPPDGKQ